MQSELHNHMQAQFDLVGKHTRELCAAIEAVEAAMQTKARAATRDDDTLFFAGAELEPSDDQGFADFAGRLGWKIVYVAYSQEAMGAGCASITKISCYLPFTEEQVGFMHYGKLWQARDASRLAIVFPAAGLMLRLSSRGHLKLIEHEREFETAGFDRARFALAKHRSNGSRNSAMLSTIGSVPVVSTLASAAKGAAVA
jgi:hypothetical protein